MENEFLSSIERLHSFLFLEVLFIGLYFDNCICTQNTNLVVEILYLFNNFFSWIVNHLLHWPIYIPDFLGGISAISDKSWFISRVNYLFWEGKSNQENFIFPLSRRGFIISWYSFLDPLTMRGWSYIDWASCVCVSICMGFSAKSAKTVLVILDKKLHIDITHNVTKLDFPKEIDLDWRLKSMKTGEN